MPCETWQDPDEPNRRKRLKLRYRAPFAFDPTYPDVLAGIERVRLQAAREGDARLTKAAQIVMAYATGLRCGNAEPMPVRKWPTGSADALDYVILSALHTAA